MLCPFCGSAVDSNATNCGGCGADLSQTRKDNPFGDDAYASPLAEQPRKAGSNESLAVKMIVPVGRSIYAIAAGYAGLISLGCCFLGPIAVLLGVLAFRDISANPHLGGKGRAVFGIVTGMIGTIGLILAILGAVIG